MRATKKLKGVTRYYGIIAVLKTSGSDGGKGEASFVKDDICVAGLVVKTDLDQAERS